MPNQLIVKRYESKSNAELLKFAHENVEKLTLEAQLILKAEFFKRNLDFSEFEPSIGKEIFKNENAVIEENEDQSLILTLFKYLLISAAITIYISTLFAGDGGESDMIIVFALYSLLPVILISAFFIFAFHLKAKRINYLICSLSTYLGFEIYISIAIKKICFPCIFDPNSGTIAILYFIASIVSSIVLFSFRTWRNEE
jgi:hypothetical protein